MKPRIYISGAITGQPNGNKEAFEEAEIWLIANGYEPVNPHVICSHLNPNEATHADYMRVCIKHIPDCDGVVILAGSASSKGAIVEQGLCEVINLYHEYFNRLRSIEALRDVFRGKSLGSLEHRQKLGL